MSAATGTLPAWRPAMISRHTTPASTTRKARSTTAAATGHGRPAQAMRPATQSPNSATSGQPVTGSRPVQFGTAVSTKPATTAAIYPKIISWACQFSAPNGPAGSTPVAIITSHSGTASAAVRAPPRKNGRKP
jgi:hypothetical protein